MVISQMSDGMTSDEHTYKLGDTVKVERKVAYKQHTAEDNNRMLWYALNNQLPPECVPEYDYITLTSQALVDEYNGK